MQARVRRWIVRGAVALILTALAVAGLWWWAADRERVHTYSGDAPPMTMAASLRKPPRLALVLGGGGPRGFAHVGVLKVLERENIRPDIIVGSSMGGLIGVMYGAKPDARALEAYIVDAELAPSWRDFTLVRSPWLKGDQFEQLLRARLGSARLETLSIPVVAVATDVLLGEPVAFATGDATTAVRAPTAVPGTFKRVSIAGKEYFDGDISAPVPVRIARQMGAQIVIAVDVMCHPSEMMEVMRDYPDLFLSDFYRHAINLRDLPQADVIISPRLGYYAGFSREERIRFIGIGEAAAMAALPELKRLLKADASTVLAK